MIIDILTLFPKMVEAMTSDSILKRALDSGKVGINIYDLRRFSSDKHKKVDDKPFGGGPGMVLMAKPIFEAVEWLKGRISNKKVKPRIVLMTPQGEKLNQKLVKKVSIYRHLILICGHYEGIDERVRKFLVTDEISIGDYILTGGELPAMVLVDAVVRLLPGVLGDSESNKVESFSDGFLEYPQYTRPAVYRDMKVPKIILSGNHKLIKEWRDKESIRRTSIRRPDLFFFAEYPVACHGDEGRRRTRAKRGRSRVG